MKLPRKTKETVKPDPYKGKDAVKIRCVEEYRVGQGDGKPDVIYEAGKVYAVGPATAAHFLRKTFNMRRRGDDGRLRYVGDGVFFEAVEDAPDPAAKPSKAAKAVVA